MISIDSSILSEAINPNKIALVCVNQACLIVIIGVFSSKFTGNFFLNDYNKQISNTNKSSLKY